MKCPFQEAALAGGDSDRGWLSRHTFPLKTVLWASSNNLTQAWILSPRLPSSGASEHTASRLSKPSNRFHKLSFEVIAVTFLGDSVTFI